jgi:Predicted AAA-ATPase/PD-(D/E)XK nuclease superfamily
MKKKLPVGVQDFPSLIKDGQAYVDKTELIYRLLHENRFYFLSRPRRFGKSLLVSTLATLFRGERDLFEGTWIAGSDYDWPVHPVLKLDFSILDGRSPEQLGDSLNRLLIREAAALGIKVAAQPRPAETLTEIVTQLSKTIPVVVLVDEYDSPLVDALTNPQLLQANRTEMQAFFKVFKTLQGQLRFLFLTGVSRFSKVSLFSGLNSLSDLSLRSDYNALLGLTEAEIINNFDSHIVDLAQKQNISTDALVTTMRRWYNGYLFAQANHTERVYNPWSLFNYLQTGQLKNYWFSSATPAFAIRLIRERNFPLANFEHPIEAGDEIEENYDPESVDLVSLLFQTGYLTIDRYESKTHTYFLRPPNEEVNRSLLTHLFRAFVQPEQWEVKPFLRQLRQALLDNNLHLFFECFNQLLADVPHQIHQPSESYYHSLLYLTVRMLGFDVDAEVSTSRGRIDMVVTTDPTLYLFEFKIDSSAKRALKQIRDNGYADRFASQDKPVTLVGASFSTKSRTIDDWQEVPNIK